jgi:lipoyl(octanoyl) transferase
LLEEVLIATCGRYGVKAFRTENTGVWTSSENKIAAIGVHLRRHITSHGVGLNVSTDLGWFERIVACGLEGKGSTSLEHEGLNGLGVEEVGRVFVDEFAERIEKVDGVKTIEEDAIEGWDANKKPG